MLMLVLKIWGVAVAVIVVVLAYKIFLAKPKAKDGFAGYSPAPESKPEKPAPPWATFAITFSEDALKAIEEVRLITGAQDFKEVMFHAFIHYEGLVRFKTNGYRIYAQHIVTGKTTELDSDQLHLAGHVKIGQA